MIKGCQKKMIHVKNTNSPYFEEAFFVVKNDVDPALCENDMRKEAQRIADSCLAGEGHNRLKLSPKKVTALLLILSGIAFTASVVMLIACICA